MKKKVLIIIMCIVLLLTGSFAIYVNDYYHADENALICLQGTDEVCVEKIGQGYFFDGKGNNKALIFYPGAKVEFTAYAPLLYSLAEQGIDCFLIKMPCNLAMFGISKADDIMNDYRYDEWYIAGHSLGGAMSAVYAAENGDKLNGLILMAAYATKDIADNVDTLVIYGSNDLVVNFEKLKAGNDFLHGNTKEICIDGGNHGQFGNYGFQKGDGVSTITNDEQQEITVKAVLDMIND